MKSLLLWLGLVLSVSCHTRAPEATHPSRPDLLRKLDGKWLMTGHVMEDSVSYHLSVRPVLSGTFSELHMIDMADPPQYEALVFVGYDSTQNRVISHWLDSFGALYSIPHGTGVIRSNKIEFIVPYEKQPFRDILTFHPQSGTWTFLIESKSDESDGAKWTTFARYTMTRP